jgi:1-acyl-sn-glycerol-3-phosphate acyltransferase
VRSARRGPSGPSPEEGRSSAVPPPRRHLVRSQLNRVLVLGSLLLLLPSVAVAERLRAGWGRALAGGGVAAVAKLCGVTFDVRGQPIDRSDPAGAAVVVANHSSPMDIPALLVAVPEIRFLAAQDLFRIPLLSSAMRALGTVPIDRRNPEHGRRQLEELVNRHNAGDSSTIAIFPEGGIAPAGKRLPFKSGAFSLAIRTGSSIAPVALRGTDAVLPPGGRLAVHPGVVTVEWLEPVETTGLTMDDRPDLRQGVQDLIGAATATTQV